MVRGFMREILSIASWAAAAGVTLYFQKSLLPIAKQQFTNDYVATGVVIGGLFLGTLLIVSIITIKISDTILDSRIGALDRTLGFLFGLGRGLVIVVVAFMFLTWLVPGPRQPEWVAKAKSKVVLQSTGDWLVAQLPDNLDSIASKLFKKKPVEEQEPPDAAPPTDRTRVDAPGTRSDLGGELGGESEYNRPAGDRFRRLSVASAAKSQ